MPVSHLRCIACEKTYSADIPMNLCAADRRPVEIVMDLERLSALENWYRPERKDMWRFGALLPLDVNDAAGRRHIVSLGEGHTPVLECGDHPIAKKAGFTLGIKEEGSAQPGFGANPTRSFKDRGMSMAVSMARWHGLEKLAIPTQGNAGDSLCAYADAAGMRAVIAMPEDTPMPILGRVAAFAHRSARFHLETVKGTIREAGELLKREWLPDGWFNLATFQEPGWRIEGKKTLGLELAEPDSPGEPWSLPDVIIYPTGGGTGVLGMWKAFAELEFLGLIGGHRPRMICVQSEATAPLVHAFEKGLADTVAAPAGRTLAFGLNVPGGIGHFRVLEIIRESDGCAIAVPEEAMHRTLAAIWQHRHWWIGPEGAACLAAIPRLVDEGRIRKGERVIAFNTGSLEKYLPELRHLL